MHGMAAAPMIVGCEGQHADRAPGPVVRPSPAEERAVAAVVLDHEEPDEEARCGDGDRQTEEIAPLEARPHQDPQQHKRHRRDGDLEQAAQLAGRAIAGEDGQPVASGADAARHFGVVQTSGSVVGGLSRPSARLTR